jgi:hypothetical protein
MKSNDKPQPRIQSQEPNLDQRYGKIGILAVAAALPYQSDAKNPAYAPVIPHRDDKRRTKTAV